METESGVWETTLEPESAYVVENICFTALGPNWRRMTLSLFYPNYDEYELANLSIDMSSAYMVDLVGKICYDQQAFIEWFTKLPKQPTNMMWALFLVLQACSGDKNKWQETSYHFLRIILPESEIRRISTFSPQEYLSAFMVKVCEFPHEFIVWYFDLYFGFIPD
jgi:hypothetical protein